MIFALILHLNREKLTAKVTQIANDLKHELIKIYGNELVDLILYGSYARGDFNENSDIDFAVVLNSNDIKPLAEINRISDTSTDLRLKYNELISILPVSYFKKSTSNFGVYQEIRKDGISI